MPSSISSSEPFREAAPATGTAVRWRRFFLTAIGTAAGIAAVVYGFIVVIDPWDVLPLSPNWQRAPMSKNQRFSYASLVRNPKFDSLVLGTSTIRLLRPDLLDQTLGGTFANLSMNSATPYEQSRMLDIFRRSHKDIRTVIVGVDFRWCETKVDKYFYQPFPEHMYRLSQWRNYGQMFSLYAAQEAMAQFTYLLGLRAARFGMDGYANFLPDDSRYDPTRAAAGLPPPFPTGQLTDDLEDVPGLRLPALDLLPGMLAELPAAASKIILLPPSYLGTRAPPGSASAAPLAACKYRIVDIARRFAGTSVVDFAIDSPITRDPRNYWDSLHFRIGLVERIVADLGAAVNDPDTASPDFRVLLR